MKKKNLFKKNTWRDRADVRMTFVYVHTILTICWFKLSSATPLRHLDVFIMDEYRDRDNNLLNFSLTDDDALLLTISAISSVSIRPSAYCSISATDREFCSFISVADISYKKKWALFSKHIIINQYHQINAYQLFSLTLYYVQCRA